MNKIESKRYLPKIQSANTLEHHYTEEGNHKMLDI